MAGSKGAVGTRIGYVPQKLDLERDLPITGRDLLSAKRQVVDSDEDVDELVRRVGLEGQVRKPIGELSGGQLERLLVALALVGKPDVLLLDELTSGVDAPGQKRPRTARDRPRCGGTAHSRASPRLIRA